MQIGIHNLLLHNLFSKAFLLIRGDLTLNYKIIFYIYKFKQSTPHKLIHRAEEESY